MFAVPAALAVTTPLESTVATFVLLDFHVTVPARLILDDEQIVIAANQGEPLSGRNSQAEEEYRNICRRLLGEEVPFAELRSKKGMFQRIGDFFRK